MLLFINGPFGIGKTTAAKLVVERIPGAMLYDPEIVGFCLREILGPVENVSDFQDLALWRRLVVELARLLKDTYKQPLIMPMTVWRRDYFAAIIEGLRRIDADLTCVRLTASADTLRQRILSRPDAEGPRDWCLTHLESGLAAAHDPAFGMEVRTDDRTPAEVAKAILALLPYASLGPEASSASSSASLTEFFRRSPLAGMDIDLERAPDVGRDVELEL